MKNTLLGVGGVIALGLFASHGNAAVLYDSKGFESAGGFAPGTLQGQSPTDAPVWQVATTALNAANASSVTVQSTVVNSGTQAVQFTRGISDYDTYYAPVFNITPSSRYLDVSWNMYVAGGATLDPFFGIYAFNYPDSLAYGGVDGTTGQVIYSQGGTGAMLTTGRYVALNSWNAFTLQLDYTSQAATLFVNGSAYATSGLIGSNETGFTDADIASFSTNASQTATGTAYFDNYMIATSNSAVPEPTCILIATAGLGLSLGSGRRRR